MDALSDFWEKVLTRRANQPHNRIIAAGFHTARATKGDLDEAFSRCRDFLERIFYAHF
jgi:hypothetical protein